MDKVTPFSKKIVTSGEDAELGPVPCRLQGSLAGLRHIKLANQKLSRRWKTILNIGKKGIVVPVLINLPE